MSLNKNNDVAGSGVVGRDATTAEDETTVGDKGAQAEATGGGTEGTEDEYFGVRLRRRLCASIKVYALCCVKASSSDSRSWFVRQFRMRLASCAASRSRVGLSRLRCQSQIASNDAMSLCHRNRRCDVRYIVRCHLWIQTAHCGYKTTKVSSLCSLLTESGQNFGCHFGRPKVGDLVGSAVLMWAADIARCIAHRTRRIASQRCCDV